MSRPSHLPLRALMALLGLAAAARAGGTARLPESFPDVVARVRLGLGAVGTCNPANHPPLVFNGSGFFIDNRGHFLTADHVIEGIAKRKHLADLHVFLPSDTEPEGHTAKVLARDARFDIAVLEVQGGDYCPLAIGDSAAAREGQSIAFSGFPFGLQLGLHPSTAVGIISSICPIAVPAVNSRQLDAETIEALRNPFNIFQLDATAYPGNSGCPLYDPRTGKVLAIVNRAGISKTKERIISTGMSYAMPIHLAKEMIERCLKKK
jgi:serine protease Do